MSLPFKVQDERLFLNSEPQWRSRLGPGWVGTKILGRGSFGVVGLWEYKGPASIAPRITQVVVKMSEAKIPGFPEIQPFPQSKIDEGVTLKRLAACRSKHIVRIYGGNRLGDRFGEVGEVVKLFLEYCPSGDMGSFLSKYETEPLAPLAEVDLWAMFHCMALGLAVMARGTEDVDKPEWCGREKNVELVHFDLKPDNIFLGRRDQRHMRMPIAKIGDFGEAYEVMKPKYQDDEYGSIASNRGMSYYHPPEETLRDPYHPFNLRDLPCPRPVKGTPSNIFQVGLILNQLLLRTQKRFDDAAAASQCTTINLNPSCHYLLTYPNHSLDLETAEQVRLYSKELRILVMECLLRPPLARPDIKDLVRRTEAGLESARGLGAGQKELPVPPSMRNAPFVNPLQQGEDEPPTAWNVDDTTSDYIEMSFHLSQNTGVYERGGQKRPGSAMGAGSGGNKSSYLGSIFSGQGDLKSMKSSSTMASSVSAGAGSMLGTVGGWMGGSGFGSGSGSRRKGKGGVDVEMIDDWEEMEKQVEED